MSWRKEGDTERERKRERERDLCRLDMCDFVTWNIG